MNVLHPCWKRIALTHLPRHLRRYRRRSGVPLTVLAAQVGCTVQTLRAIQAGRTTRPQRWLLDALGTVLGVQIDTNH